MLTVVRGICAAMVAGAMVVSGGVAAEAGNDPGVGGSPGRAAIAKKYKKESRWLGRATGGVSCTLVDGGCMQHYQNGSIYWHRSTGAHFLRGEIRRQWVAQGNERKFGYPTEDERHLSADRKTAWQPFQKANFHWKEGLGAHPTFGHIEVKWTQMRREQGPLGFPTSGVLPTGRRDGGQHQRFEHGMMYWRPGHSAHPVLNGPIMSSFAVSGFEVGKHGYGYPAGDPQPWGQRFERGSILNNHSQWAVDWAFRVDRGDPIMSMNGSHAWRGGVLRYGMGGGHGRNPGPANGVIDCSGFVRWMFHLAHGRDITGPGDSDSFLRYRAVGRRHVRSGDVLIRPGKGAKGHIMLVVRRISDSRFVVAEATGGKIRRVVIRERGVSGDYVARRVG